MSDALLFALSVACFVGAGFVLGVTFAAAVIPFGQGVLERRRQK